MNSSSKLGLKFRRAAGKALPVAVQRPFADSTKPPRAGYRALPIAIRCAVESADFSISARSVIAYLRCDDLTSSRGNGPETRNSRAISFALFSITPFAPRIEIPSETMQAKLASPEGHAQFHAESTAGCGDRERIFRDLPLHTKSSLSRLLKEARHKERPDRNRSFSSPRLALANPPTIHTGAKARSWPQSAAQDQERFPALVLALSSSHSISGG